MNSGLRWQRDGTWRQVVTALQARAAAAGLLTWDVSVDSTVARAHQHAAGARRDGHQQREPPGLDQIRVPRPGGGHPRTRPDCTCATR